jgi:hypothetical protein
MLTTVNPDIGFHLTCDQTSFLAMFTLGQQEREKTISKRVLVNIRGKNGSRISSGSTSKILISGMVSRSESPS